MDLEKALPLLLPIAVEWAERQSRRILLTGAPLAPPFQSIAREVGVRKPERIRILFVPAIPSPEDVALASAAAQTGLIGPNIQGMTLGHGIFFRNDTRGGRELIAHECRHVYQYESYGSIAAFLAEYLMQVITRGYHNAPMEIDAREAAKRFA
jgi:hypothetical protein